MKDTYNIPFDACHRGHYLQRSFLILYDIKRVYVADTDSTTICVERERERQREREYIYILYDSY